MDLKEIQKILKLMDRHGLTEFRHERDDERLVLKRGRDENAQSGAMPGMGQMPYVAVPPSIGAQPAATVGTQPAASPGSAAADTPAPQEDTTVQTIPSPMVGTFYAASSPESDAFVSVGDIIDDDTVVCIVEAMKIMNEIKAEVSGAIVEVCVKNGQAVEFGQALFKVKAS
jgi:acetyl-CoA carboxylase biotin carboxyl carrier protein